MSIIDPKNEREAQRERARLDRMWSSIERAAAPRFASEISVFGKAVASAVDGGKGRFAIDQIARLHAMRLQHLLARIYETAMRSTRKLIIGDAGKRLSVVMVKKDFTSQFETFLQTYITQEGLSKSITIAERNKAIVAEIINNMTSQGASLTEIANEVGTWAQVSNHATRGAMIARTEVHAASQAASLQTASTIDFGQPMNKRWVAAKDSRTRSSHEHIDGTIVAMDGVFRVKTGNPLRYPSDKRGDPSETINCRCALVYTAKPVT